MQAQKALILGRHKKPAPAGKACAGWLLPLYPGGCTELYQKLTFAEIHKVRPGNVVPATDAPPWK